MKKHLALVAAASMAVSGMGLCSWAQAQGQTDTGTGSQQQMGQPSGQGTADQTGTMSGQTGPGQMGAQQAPQADQVRRTLTQIASAAISSDPIGNLSGLVSREDRDRIKQGADQQKRELQSTVSAFRNDWKSRYNQDFKFGQDQQVALSNYQILPGTIGGEAQPAGGFIQPGQQPNQPGQTSGQGTMDQSGQPSGQQRSDQQSSQGQTGASGQMGQQGAGGQAQVGGYGVSGQAGQQGASGQAGNLSGQAQPAGATQQPGQMGQQDQNHSTVIIPADPQHNLPQTTLHFVNEDGSWKLDLPNNVTGQTLSQNLKDHLYVLGQQKSNWPNDANQAYSVTAHHIFAALAGEPAQGGMGGMGAQPGQTGGGMGGQTGGGTGGQSGQSGQ